MDINSSSLNKIDASDALKLSDEAAFLSDIVETQNDLASVELDVSIIMRMVAERIGKLANADGATVQLLEGDELVCRAVTGIMEPHVGLKLPLAASLAGRAVQTCSFQYAQDGEDDSRVHKDAIRRVGFRSIVAVPLIHNGRGIGAIIALSNRPSAFEPRHIAALRLMAGLVVASLVHASEFEIKKSLLAERTAALSSLRESEQRFRNLFEHASDAVFLHDLEGRFLDVNVLACKNLGYSREELLKMSVTDVEADLNLAQVKQHCAQLQFGKPVMLNGTHVRRDGTTFPVEIRIVLIEHAGQKAVLGIARDVSERKRIEAALRESQERFRSAFEHAAIGMAMVSLEGRFLQVNQSLCRITGYTEQELLVRDFQSITHTDDLGGDLAFVRKLIAGDVPDYKVVKRYIHRMGQLVWVSLSVSLVRDEAGKPAYFISQIQDITKRQQAEEALRTSEEEYRAIFDLAGVGKVQADLKTGRYLRVNEKFCQMLGYSAVEFECMTFSQITHPDDNAADCDTVARMLRGEISEITFEKRYVRKDGGVIWGLLNLAVLKDGSGRPVRTVGTVQNITERKHSEWLERDRRRVLEMVAQGLPLAEVLDRLARAVERQISGSHAAVFLIQHGNISIHGPNLPKAWQEALQPHRMTLAAKLSADIWNSGGACGVTMINSNELWSELCPVAGDQGICACWSVAIQSSEDTPLGLLSVFCVRSQGPTPAEAQTLDMYTKLAAICIDHHHASGQLSRLVTHDRLTGLPNRMMFEDRMQQALVMAARTKRHVAIMALDIDKFKSINDTLGHQAGDQLLQQFAHRLRGQLRESDTMARIGGDEFAVILSELETADGAAVVAQKMVASMAEPFALADQMIRVTSSIGIARFPQDGRDAVILVKKADEALYRAKENGRNGFSF